MEQYGPLKFDREGTYHTAVDELEYGLLDGNTTVLVIQAGRGGSIYGYEGKYLRLAHEMHRKHGCTVVVSSYPWTDYLNSIQYLYDKVDSLMKERGCPDYHIYLYATSAGALLAAQTGTDNPRVEKMLLTNCPLNINWDRTKRGIQDFEGGELTFAYGSEDPSTGMIMFLERLTSDKVHLKILQDEDHYLSVGKNTLEKLVEEIFFGVVSTVVDPDREKRVYVHSLYKQIKEYDRYYPEYRDFFNLDEYLSDLETVLGIYKGGALPQIRIDDDNPLLYVPRDEGERGWGDSKARAFDQEVIKHIHTGKKVFEYSRSFTIGGGKEYQVILRDGRLEAVRRVRPPLEMCYIHPINEEEIDELMAVLNPAKAWKNHYETDVYDILDGYSWGLEFDWKDLQFHSGGYVDFPKDYYAVSHQILRVFDGWLKSHVPECYDITKRWDRLTDYH